MQYDPIKRSLGNVFNKTPFLRIVFYKMLNLLLLRTWHIKNELYKWANEFKGNADILDAGSGYGQYSYFLSNLRKNFKGTAVDVKQEQIDDCNGFFKKINKKNITFKYADLTQFDEKQCYDLILSVDVMEHILEDVKVFENFYKALKNGGTLLVSTPSNEGGSDVNDHEHESFIGEHVRDGYGVDEIKTKLEFAGFKNIIVKYSYGVPGNISWKLSMKYPILMLNASKIFFLVLPFYYILLLPLCLSLNWLDTKITHKTGTGLIVKANKL